ncbi:extensin family protein, partial [Paramagnetospirillum caucaseum]|uniref:extensin family protein n=1 Tax=Paramagnetospirillum caucaseum TaxID=1244869 RepID=UPI001F1806F5
MSHRLVFAVLTLALLGACAAPPPRIVAPPPILDPDSACLRDLRDQRVTFEPQAAFGNPGSCSIANPVKVTADSQTAWNRPGVMSCSMARTVERFETQVVQAAAGRIFGQKVARLHHMGTYDCRNRRTETTVASSGEGRSRGGRLSEHGKGQAIDIGGFELADGTMISVKKDWRGAGKKSEFLQAVARASCEHFNVVLTPNHNKLHADHLHLDIRPAPALRNVKDRGCAK